MIKSKTNRAITAFLVLALLFIPFPQQARAQIKPKTVLEVCAFMVVVGVGVIIIVNLCKIAKKIPPVDNPPSPPTPPTNSVPTNHLVFNAQSSGLTMETVNNDANIGDISSAGILDPDGNPFSLLISYKLQSSTNLQQWQDECTVTGWCSSGWSVAVAYRSNQPICTNWSQSMTNAVDVPIHCAGPIGYFRQVSP